MNIAASKLSGSNGSASMSPTTFSGSNGSSLRAAITPGLMSTPTTVIGRSRTSSEA
jgi:hypothetical protein